MRALWRVLRTNVQWYWLDVVYRRNNIMAATAQSRRRREHGIRKKLRELWFSFPHWVCTRGASVSKWKSRVRR